MGLWKYQQMAEITPSSYSTSYKPVICTGIAKLKIPETGEIFEVSPDDLDWESDCSDPDREMGPELHHYATIILESEQGNYQVEATWEVWEYPIGAIEITETEVEGGEIMQDFDDFQLLPEDIELDAVLSNTKFHSTFSDQILSLRILGEFTIADSNAQKTLKRQIFIGAITCLETYLSDAFINTATATAPQNEKYLKSFFSSFPRFKNEKIKKSEIFTYVDKAKKEAREAMMGVIYHKLDIVSNMFKSTFDIAFPDFSEIARARDIETRHDLVHRNGKTKEGDEISIDEVDVDKVISRIENFVNALDQALKDKASKL